MLFKKSHPVMLALIVVAILVSSTLIGCTGAEKEKTALEVIKEKGVFKVGTSADYPPFEFVDEQGQFAGFDIELIKAVGEKIGLEVKVEDMAFDTLISALQQGKIDAVIACMSPTPDRLKEADFTDPYFRTFNAVLVKNDSTIVIDQPEALADHSIGVQTGTTHDEWVTQNLLEPGKIKEGMYFRYQQVDQGIIDLISGRIDVFITDLSPAEDLIATQPVKMAFQGELTPGENPGIVVAKDSPELLAVLNQALQDLQTEKYIAGLSEKYLEE